MIKILISFKPSEGGLGNEENSICIFGINMFTMTKCTLFKETIYQLILHSYKYHSIASEQDGPEQNVIQTILLFFYHCVQLVMEVIIILLVAYNLISGGKNNLSDINLFLNSSMLLIKTYFQI